MSEALKGKEREFNVGVINTKVKGFLTVDVKFAVVYLKEQLLKKGYCKPGDDLLWEVNAAFPDVTDGVKNEKD